MRLATRENFGNLVATVKPKGEATVGAIRPAERGATIVVDTVAATG